MLGKKNNAQYGVIGLGRFGFALARRLSEAGREVLVLDKNESKIRQIRPFTENAFVVSQLNMETLAETGIQNCETVVVCIGEKIDTSILTTLNVIKMGVPNVIARAISPDEGMVLETLGAQVVYPENDMALRLANRLLSSRALDFIELHGDISISEQKITSRLANKTVLQADLRGRFGLNIIAAEIGGETTTEITPDMTLHEGDIIVVVGKKENITRLEALLIDE